MTQLVFKNDLEKNKLEALLVFLKTWNIEAELKTSTPKAFKKQKIFSLSSGLWSDYFVDSKELRNKAWSR
jgi:hypothetical protein